MGKYLDCTRCCARVEAWLRRGRGPGPPGCARPSAPRSGGAGRAAQGDDRRGMRPPGRRTGETMAVCGADGPTCDGLEQELQELLRPVNGF